MESSFPDNPESDAEEKMNKALKNSLLVFNGLLLAVGNCGGPLLMRLYFLKGGEGVWISSFLQTAGWPLVLFPLVVSYIHRRGQEGARTKSIYITPRLFLACAGIGLLTGLDDFLSAYGVSLLPVSTSALIIATQLGFTAGFAFILVKQKFTASTINAIFLLSLGAVVLVLHASTDRPAYETNKEYFMGFSMTLGASALYGFVLPAVELTYKKAAQNITYTLVMEMQMVMSFFATLFCATGMLLHKDFTVSTPSLTSPNWCIFDQSNSSGSLILLLLAHELQAIAREASEFELGRDKYITVLVCSAVLWQCFFMGAVGVIFCGSSLLSGIIIATLLPLTETLAVLFFHEKFHVEKGIALVLSLWGFTSYFYGELRQKNRRSQPT